VEGEEYIKIIKRAIKKYIYIQKIISFSCLILGPPPIFDWRM
jgi:hypothetical protein